MMQFVHVVEGGARAQMSKRKGEFVTLDELIDDIGADATRFFMLQRSHDTPVDLDLELARRTSKDNPVYYVQYAHARIASILRKAAARGRGERRGRERDLRRGRGAGRALRAGPDQAALRASCRGRGDGERRAPHRLCAYATATAADFHAFYRDCQVVGARGRGRGGVAPGVVPG